MLALSEQHAEVAARLAAELAEVETRFATELASDLACVNELALHLEQYRGKMLRPMLVLLSGWAVEPEVEADIAAAASSPFAADFESSEGHRILGTVVEMVHMATLVHDDVLDEQDVRRKGVTINQLRGNEAAVMLGDYLISHAYHLCSSLQSQVAARLIAATTNTVCEGELLQLANRNNWSLDEQTYFDIIRRKTASLCGMSCRLGALLSGATPQRAEAMASYGERLGMAFQIVDDVLDLTGDPEVVGKSLGKDLEKGKLTLPLIHRLETAGSAERQQLLHLLRDQRADRARQVGQILLESGSVEYARRQAEALVERAKADIADLPDTPYRATLTLMAGAVLTREF